MFNYGADKYLGYDLLWNDSILLEGCLVVAPMESNMETSGWMNTNERSVMLLLTLYLPL